MITYVFIDVQFPGIGNAIGSFAVGYLIADKLINRKVNV